MSVLIIAEHDNNGLKGATLNALTAASLISDDVTMLVVGQGIDNAIEQAQCLDGLTKILKCDNPNYSNAIAEDLSALVLSIVDGYSHILAPATTFGKNLMPRISAKLDTQQISDIISVDSADTFKEPF